MTGRKNNESLLLVRMNTTDLRINPGFYSPPSDANVFLFQAKGITYRNKRNHEHFSVSEKENEPSNLQQSKSFP